jgi:outer membrane biosynthesis protein TonB
MAAFANLSAEERIGLGLAAAAHVALVAGLMWQVRDNPTKLPVPERIEVSLAEEVSLQSAAPNPAAAAPASVAPVLAEQPTPPAPVAVAEPVPPEPVRETVRPVPKPVPKPVIRPTPAPRPSARPSPAARPTASASTRPTPRQSASPAPRPSQSSRPAGGTRIGADFLEGTSSGERNNARGTPAATFGAAEAASLVQSISRQIKPHWSAPQGADAELLVSVLSFELNQDGSLRGRPRLVSQSGVNDANRPQADLHAERAIRAVQLAAPFDLPEQYYDKWKRVSQLRFDRRL